VNRSARRDCHKALHTGIRIDLLRVRNLLDHRIQGRSTKSRRLIGHKDCIVGTDPLLERSLRDHRTLALDCRWNSVHLDYSCVHNERVASTESQHASALCLDVALGRLVPSFLRAVHSGVGMSGS